MSSEREAALISRIAQRVFVHATKMIYDANHRSDVEQGDPKVGGHPASCSSCVHIMTALHVGVRQAQDIFAVKPHASPVDHALNYALGTMHKVRMQEAWLDDSESQRSMNHLRKFSQAGEPVFQSYHSEWDPDGYYYFPSGSVGIPPVISQYTALAYRYAKDHGFEVPEDAHFWSLIGDSEFREGSLMEAMPDAAERELNNVTWIVDYNRQNLDGTRIPNPRGLRGTDGDRMERVALANGWKVIQVRHGRKRLACFAKPKGKRLAEILEHGFSDFAFQMLLLARSGERVRSEILELDGKLESLISKYSDEELFGIFEDLGGHDVHEVLAALRAAKTSVTDPTMIVAHTIKGWGLNCFADSGNHSALPNEEEVNALLASEGLSASDPFVRLPEDSEEGRLLQQRRVELRAGTEAVWALRERNRKSFDQQVEDIGSMPDTLGLDLRFLPEVHTQYVWGQLAAKLIRIGNRQEGNRRGEVQKQPSELEARWGPAAEMVLTMAPDVGTSTNINPAMDDKVYGPASEPDWQEKLGLQDRRRPKLSPHEDAWTRHIRFEIAEANCMSAAGAFGKMDARLGIPFLPVMTVYDFFIKRAYDQLYYNLYWDAGFVVIGTPSGVTLSPEGAQHSWKSDIQMPNVITWEPFYAVEVDWILADTVRRHYLRDNAGRSGVVIRCVTRSFRQGEMLERLKVAQRFQGLDETSIFEATRQDALQGAYYLVDYRGQDGYRPGENAVHIFAMGAMCSEALLASDRLRADGIFANVIVVTCGDLLCGNLGHETGYQHLRQGLGVDGSLHLAPIDSGAELALAAGQRIPMVSVVDGEPGLLDNLGSVVGVRCETLAVRKASKSGRPSDVYGYLKIDADAVYAACGQVLADTAMEDVQIGGSALTNLQTSERGELRAQMWPPNQ